MTEETQVKEKNPNVMPRYSVSLTKRNIEQVKAIQDELGFASISETVRGCIHNMHSKTFPSYARQVTAKAVDTTPPKTQEELVEASRTKSEQRRVDTMKRAEQQKANELSTNIEICERELGGAVGEDDKGNPAKCAYFQYDGRRRFEQEIDLGSVTSELTETQYLPNRDRVMQLQKDGNVDYDPNEKIEDVLG